MEQFTSQNKFILMCITITTLKGSCIGLSFWLMDNATILELYNGDISSTASSAHVLTDTLFFTNMKEAASITIRFLTAFFFMKYVRINFQFSKK